MTYVSDEARASPIVEDERRIVVYRTNHYGHADEPRRHPVSLPRITMHVLAREENIGRAIISP
jgi:hypothetical protein